MIRIISLALVLLSSCSLSSEQEGRIAKVVSVQEFKELIAKKTDVQLIDVRTPEEFKAGHLPKAVSIDYYKSDFKALLSKLDMEKPVAVYCAVGGRSGSTLKLLKSMGFKEAYDLSGGIRAWQKEKLPIER